MLQELSKRKHLRTFTDEDGITWDEYRVQTYGASQTVLVPASLKDAIRTDEPEYYTKAMQREVLSSVRHELRRNE